MTTESSKTKFDAPVQDELRSLLDFDALSTAEKLTGTSYKTDEATGWLGLALMHANAGVKNRELLARNDTLLSNDLNRYQQIITDYGFSKVWEFTHISQYQHDGQDQDEIFFVYYHPVGFLLTFTTYKFSRPEPTQVDGGHVYFAWRPHNEQHYKIPPTSIAWTDDIAYCSLDCREALIFNLDSIQAEGTIIAPWPAHHWLFRLTCGADYRKVEGETLDEAGDRRNRLNRERLAQLPECVRELVGPWEAGS